MIIYYIKNKINNKMYIGQTIHDLQWRINGHLQCVKRGVNRKLYNAIRKYGWDNFEYDVICNCNNLEELNEKETQYIVELDCINNGYNMCLGGDNNVMFCETIKQKHDDIMRSDKVRQKISQTMKTLRKQPFTQQTRQKISQKLKGNTHFKGKCHREDSKLKISQSKYKKVLCEDLQLQFNNIKEASIWWQSNGNPLKHWRSIAADIKKSSDNNICVKNLTWKYI